MAEDNDRGSTDGSSHPDGNEPARVDPAAQGAVDRSVTDGAGTNGSVGDGSGPDAVTEPTAEELAALTAPVEDDGPERDDDGDGDADGELVGVGAPTTAARRSVGDGTAETKARSGGVARSKKDKATPKQQQVATKPKRTTPAQFVRESVGELRKVVYPTGSQLANYFVVVLVFVLFIIAVVSLLDLGLGALILKIFA